MQACHSCSICQTRTFAQSVYRSHQPTAFADLISSTDLVREFRQLRRIVLARGQFAERLQFRTEAGTHVEPSFGEIELKTTGKSVSHKAPNCAIYRSDRNSVRCRTFPATSASQEIACECQMPSPLEDRIRELCLKAAVAQNEADLDQIIRQLRAALTEYIHDARIRAVEVIPRRFRSDKKTA